MSEFENGDESKLEVLPPSALLSIERASVDGQIATAHAYPRSLEQFKKRALGMVSLDSETADSCIYCRPVGKEKNEKGEWIQKFVEGPSIRLAEIVSVAYGNIRAYSRVIEQTDRFVRCEGFAHDLESNAAMKSECVESTVTSEGKPYSERQRALMAKVCLKKALRDAIFTIVPRALCKPIFDKAKQVATGADKPLEERRKKAQSWVGSLKIDESRVFAALNVKGWNDVTADHLITLTGLRTAIAEKDETIDSAFPPLETPGKKEDKTKPAATGHQQATGGNLNADKSVPKVDGTQTATTPETPKTPQEKPAEPPATSSPAPATATPEPQKPAEATPNEPAPEPDQAFACKEGESDGLKSVKLVAAKAGISMLQLMTFLIKKKLAREGQKLADLAEGKLSNVANHLNAWLPDIRQLPR